MALTRPLWLDGGHRGSTPLALLTPSRTVTVPQLIVADLGGNELVPAAAQGGTASPPSCVLTSRVVLGGLAWARAHPSPSACVHTLQGNSVHNTIPLAPLEGGLALAEQSPCACTAVPQVGNRARGCVPLSRENFPLLPPCVCPPRTGPSGSSMAPPPVATSRVVAPLPHLPCPCELIQVVYPTGGTLSWDDMASWLATLGWWSVRLPTLW